MTPAAMAGNANEAMLNLNPNRETIHAVIVVPILAPMMTPIACAREIKPALTNPTTSTVVAELDWVPGKPVVLSVAAAEALGVGEGASVRLVAV